MTAAREPAVWLSPRADSRVSSQVDFTSQVRFDTINTMDKETRKYLEGMEKRLASKEDLVSMEGRVITAIEHSQEDLARMTKRGFDDTDNQFGVVRTLLGAIAEAVDADLPAWKEGVREGELLDTYRKDLDGLARRVKELEQRPAKRR